MNICIFEDEKYIDFFPLTLSRPVFELKTGTRTIREKIRQQFPEDNIFLLTRPYLKDVFSHEIDDASYDIPSDSILFINSRIIPDSTFKKQITSSTQEKLFFDGETLIAAWVKNGRKFLNKLRKGVFKDFSKENIIAKTVKYPWDLISINKDEIEKEFSLFGSNIPTKTRAVLLAKENIFLGRKTIVMPQVVIDAQEGPVIIDNETIVEANSYLKGPLYIGKKCLIKAGSRIYGPTSIGDVCKIGGEVSKSIFQGYSNKQHDGFIGHSYIGKWVNIGADTNNSDLKNNYKEITIYLNNKPVNTGLTFLGTLIGDHSKTAINTMLNTGTVIGFSANIFGEGFPTKYIPSFSWGGKRRYGIYKLQDAIETASKVMKRRNHKITESYRKMMEKIFELTKKERHHGT